MRIGFDLDRVFIDHPPFISDMVIDRLYKKHHEPELTYRIPSRLEQFLRRLTHYPIFRKILKENLHFLKNLARRRKDTYYLISGRFDFLKTATQKIIEKHHFDKLFTGMYFNFDNQQPHRFKNNIIKKLKLNKYVDDDLDLLKYLAKHNPRTIFYWLNPKQNTKIEKNLFAITNLKKLNI